MSWPTFFSLSAAWLFLLAIPLIILYFLKLKRPRLDVSSLVLWRHVINDQRVNAPFQKFKRNLLLWLQLAALALVTLAAMQPFWSAADKRAQYIPVLIDCSASMGATTTSGRSRLDIAKQRVRRLIDDLLPDQRLCLISVGSTARRLTEFTDHRRDLLQALDGLEPLDLPSEIEDGLRMTQSLAMTVPVSNVLLFSDGNLPPLVNFDLPFPVSYQRIDEPAGNIGITGVSARRSGLGSWELFLQIGASVSHGAAAKIVVQGGDSAWGEDYARLEPGEAKRVMMPMQTTEETRVLVSLVPDGPDAITSDNTVRFQLPRSRPLVVYCPLSLGSIRHALRAFQGVEVHPVVPADSAPRDTAPPAAVPEMYDLYFTDLATETFPAARVLVTLGIVPQLLAKHLAIESGSVSFVDWNRQAPLLRHVQLADVVVGDQARFADGFAVENLENLGFESLADGTIGPLLLERRDEGQLQLHFLFNPERSTLAYRVGFPILMANLIDLSLRESSLSEVQPLSTGVLPSQSLRPNTEYVVAAPEQTKAFRTGEDGQLAGISAPKVGEYSIKEQGQGIRWLAANLLSPLETSLSSEKDLQFRELSIKAAESQIHGDQPLWRYLAVAGFVVLLAEWWYFHRPASAVTTARYFGRAAGLFLLLAAPTIAQEGMLTGTIEDSTPSGRTHAPIDVIWRLDWSGVSLLRGSLEMEVVCDERVISTTVLEDVIVTTGEQRFRMGAPTAGANALWWPIEARLKLVTKNRTWEIGPLPLAGGRRQFRLAMGICVEDRAAQDPFLEAFVDSFEISLFSPGVAKQLNTQYQHQLMTTQTHWTRAEMPEEALRLMQFDVVILADPSLSKLSVRQLGAVHDWVRSGGSLCLVVSSTRSPSAAEFLNSLCEGDRRMPTFSLSGTTPPEEGGNEQQAIWMRRCDWGRLAILDREKLAGPAEKWLDFKEMANFVWRIRKDIQQAEVDGKWTENRSVPTPDFNEAEEAHEVVKTPLLHSESRITQLRAYQAMQRLMPKDVRVLPTSLFTAIAVGYILLIGPLDYFLLGSIGHRKWTWVTFPLSTIATTFFVIWLSHRFMDSRDQGHAILVRDLDGTGRVVAENSYQLHFQGESSYAVHDMTRAVITPMSDEWSNSYSAFGVSKSANNRTTKRTSRVVGNFPGRYAHSLWMEQWEPNMCHICTLFPDRDRFSLPAEAAAWISSPEGRSKLYESVKKQWDRDIFFFAIHGGDGFELGETTEPFESPFTFANVRWNWDAQISSVVRSFAVQESSSQEFPWFQRSPAGTAGFEDIRCCDASDPGGPWLLILATELNEDIVIYRRIFTEEIR